MNGRSLEQSYIDLYEFLKENKITHIDADFVDGYLTAIVCSPFTIDGDYWFDNLFTKNKEIKFKWKNKEERKIGLDVFYFICADIEDDLMDDSYEPAISSEIRNREPQITGEWISGLSEGLKLWDLTRIRSDEKLMEVYGLLLQFYNDPIGSFYFFSSALKKLYDNSKLRIGSKFPDLVRILKDVLKYDMKPEYVHGLMSGVICSPVKIKIDDWLYEICGDENITIKFDGYTSADIYNSFFDLYKKLNFEADNANVHVQMTESDDLVEAAQAWSQGLLKGIDIWKKHIVKDYEFREDYKIIKYYAQAGKVRSDYFKSYSDTEDWVMSGVPVAVLYDSYFRLHLKYRFQREDEDK
jgi:yecA family protein